MIRKLLLGAVLLVVLALGLFLAFGPGLADREMNPVIHPGPYSVPEAVRALHESLSIVDFHADTLLWQRDPAERHAFGHVDLPRLRDGGVAVQAFTIVTKTPRNLNYDHNTGDSDNITLLAMGELWPIRTWGSLAERVLYQAGRLADVERREAGSFLILRTAKDLETVLERRRTDRRVIGGLIGIEGAHALEDDLGNLQRFFDAGVRMISPSHFFDNGIGGSAHGVEKGGLTALGKEMVRKVEDLHMILDVAHGSRAVIDDALAVATRPLVVSHTGVTGTCPNIRNLTDKQLKNIAAKGGLIAIGFWEVATCGKDAEHIAASIAHAASVAGIDHVALGSDYDGTVEAPFDTSGMPLVTEALVKHGFSPEDIAKVMGGNGVALLRRLLPP